MSRRWTGICKVDGCNKESRYNGRSTRCEEHKLSCVAPGCTNSTARPAGASRQPGFSNGTYCQLHRGRVTKYGSTELPEKEERVNPWKLEATGYLRRSVKGRGEFQHRFVMEQHLGRKLLPHENVHHINGDRADNRLSNLELWSSSQPPGQRVDDKADWAMEILRLYRPEVLNE